MSSEKRVRIRDQRRPGWFWSENELLDVLLPLVGKDASILYLVMVRHSRKEQVSKGLRELGDLSDMGKDLVAKCLRRLAAVGMVSEQRGKPKTTPSYDLLDLTDAVALGEVEIRRRLDALERTVSPTDSSRSGKPVKKAKDKPEETAPSVVEADSSGDAAQTDLSAEGGVLQTDLSGLAKTGINIAKNQDLSILNTNPPYPPSGGDQSGRDVCGGDDPKVAILPSLVRHRIAWGGVLRDLRNGFYADRRPQHKRGNLRDGVEDYKRCFDGLSLEEVELAEGAEERLRLVLRHSDPQAALWGIRTYAKRVTWAVGRNFPNQPLPQLDVRPAAESEVAA